MSNQLIIIGNGFDLTAGLNSTYEAFFKWCFKDRDEKYVLSSDTVNFNFWKEIFWNRRKNKKFLPVEKRWSDVEAVIEEVILYCDDSFDDFGEVIDFGIDYNVISHKKNLLRDKYYDGCVTKKLFFKELYDDLKEFESNFANFLKEEVKQNEAYIENANKLLSQLIVGDFSPEKIKTSTEYFTEYSEFISRGSNSLQILSFNYTHEFNDRLVKAKAFNNVHGGFKENNIIFGIDGHNFADRPAILPFIKTYRIMSNKLDRFTLDSNLEHIKFFGHGLSEADYSYFQTIFDDVDLYNGTTELIFYINIYDESKREEIISEQYSNIVQLIQRYGKTLDNKDHGKNMMHKLLLEGRLRTEILTHKNYIFNT